MSNLTSRPNGLVVWLTGLPASGKSTLANALRDRFSEQAEGACVIDGDIMRQGLCADLGFTEEDRQENVRRAGEIAKLIADQGWLAIVALVSPYARDRQAVRGRLEAGRFLEVYVDCPVEVCRQRDPKGLYRRADRGEIPRFTGVSDPYEAPQGAGLHIRTDLEPVEASVERLVEAVRRAR